MRNMFNKKTKKRLPSRGFALLLAMVVVSVVLAISLSLLNITLKQYTLSATARDSEISFHAANTMMDCLRLYRLSPDTATSFVSSNGPNINCTGTDQSPTNSSAIDVGGGDTLYVHTYQFNVGSGSDLLCTNASIYTANAASGDIDYSLSNEGLENFECPTGTTCTMIFARGYNRPCSDLDSIRTVQRELTAQF